MGAIETIMGVFAWAAIYGFFINVKATMNI